MTAGKTTLSERIGRLIEMQGPMPLAEFMQVCLTNPDGGYYQQKSGIGADGDFITAPEVSQMFGEMIALWAYSTWSAMGEPDNVNVVELGPGRGTLMADILRTARQFPAFAQAIAVTLVEAGNSMRQTQDATLTPLGFDIDWVTGLEQLPLGPTIMVANEFLDALPVRQYVKQNGEWRERCITLDENDAFTFALGAGTLDEKLLPKGHKEEPDGAVFEISPAREALVEEIALRIREMPGACLIIDYGHTRSDFGDTFQAMRAHTYADPLAALGQTDLTSHVDFHRLANAAKKAGVEVKPLMTQGEFLIAMGLLERAGTLGANKPQEIQDRLTGEAERLALPDQMGELFKVMCITSPGLKLQPFDKR